jgi:alkanesulfonate monooxygenase SsuD/methylene tetrahydromethanopterin reductase-like flavin-dependent oxidoreductase (luciferase family)
MREEFELLGQSFERRGRRTDEMIQVLRKLWAGGWVGHRGEFYDFEPLEMSPVPAQPIPIYSGGLSAPALRRAATLCDGWISDLHTTEELRGFVTELGRLREGSERAGQPFAVIAACKDAFDLDGYRRLADIGVTHLQTQPWIFYGAADLEKKCEGVRRFGEDVIARMA